MMEQTANRTNINSDRMVRQVADKSTIPTVLASCTEKHGATWRLTLHNSLHKNGLIAEIETLSLNASDPNPFFSPTFLLPAAEYLSRLDVKFLCLHQVTDDCSRLKLFAPVKFERHRISGLKAMRFWDHPFAPLGTPLLDNTKPQETIHGFSDCLRIMGSRLADVLSIRNLPKGSKFSNMLFSHRSLSENLLRYAPFHRPGFTNRAQLQTALDNIRGRRHRKLNHARKQLDEIGNITYDRARSRERLKIALLQHMILENESWKGRSGSAILARENTRRFAEAVVDKMGPRHECEIYSIKLDGQPIASIIVFTWEGHFYPWKIAYDENYSAYSAGILLLAYVNRQLVEAANFKSLDSLASTLNVTARRVWTDECEFTSLAIGLGEKARANVLKFARRDQWIAKGKHKLKQLLGHSF